MEKTQKQNNDTIVSISVQEIYQHPDNPRKDLGELSELGESIRKNGRRTKNNAAEGKKH